jgi:hypothetical protein
VRGFGSEVVDSNPTSSARVIRYLLPVSLRTALAIQPEFSGRWDCMDSTDNASLHALTHKQIEGLTAVVLDGSEGSALGSAERAAAGTSWFAFLIRTVT